MWKEFLDENRNEIIENLNIPEIGHFHKDHLILLENYRFFMSKEGNISYYLCDYGKKFADNEVINELNVGDNIIEKYHTAFIIESVSPTWTTTGLNKVVNIVYLVKS